MGDVNMKDKLSTQQLVQLALLTAMTVAIGFIVQVPNPIDKGVVTLIDAGILLAGGLFGVVGGAIVGGLSGLLFDLLSGYPNWAVLSLLIHGLQGYVFAQLYPKTKWGAYLLSSMVMVVGYALATWWMYGLAAAMAAVPSNLFQVGVSVVVAWLLTPQVARFLKRVKV